jgi:hypothetical protein
MVPDPESSLWARRPTLIHGSVLSEQQLLTLATLTKQITGSDRGNCQHFMAKSTMFSLMLLNGDLVTIFFCIAFCKWCGTSLWDPTLTNKGYGCQNESNSFLWIKVRLFHQSGSEKCVTVGYHHWSIIDFVLIILTTKKLSLKKMWSFFHPLLRTKRRVISRNEPNKKSLHP